MNGVVIATFYGVTLMGGYGYCHEYDMERNFRDGRLAAIGGGTSEIQKLIISKLM